MKKHINITVTGRVQGVGFRYSAQEEAEELGIKGFLFWNASNNYDIVEEALKNRNPE